MGIGNPLHIAFIALVALIVLGPKRLPELARSLGNGIREFRESLESAGSPDDQPEASRALAQPAVADVQPPHAPTAAPVADQSVAAPPAATTAAPTPADSPAWSSPSPDAAPHEGAERAASEPGA